MEAIGDEESFWSSGWWLGGAWESGEEDGEDGSTRGGLFIGGGARRISSATVAGLATHWSSGATWLAVCELRGASRKEERPRGRSRELGAEGDREEMATAH